MHRVCADRVGKEFRREESKRSFSERYSISNKLCEEYNIGIRFYVCGETYKPSDDTFLLMNLIEVYDGEKVIEVGVGSGIILAYTLLKGASFGVGIDINPYACMSTILTLKANKVDEKSDVILCDKLTCINERGSFDIAIFNPPYLPGTPKNDWLDMATLGGPTGKEVLLDAIKSLKNVVRIGGRIYVVFSEPPSASKLLDKFNTLGLKINKVSRKNFFYETLYAVELVRTCKED